MLIPWKVNGQWKVEFYLPSIPGNTSGTSIVLTGYILVLEAIWRQL